MTQKYEIPKAISLTDRAAERIKHIMSRAETPKIGVRLGVKNGGCAGMEYTMDYADARDPLDEVVEDKGVMILIEPKAVLFCSVPKWIMKRASCRPGSFSTTPIRRMHAVAAKA